MTIFPTPPRCASCQMSSRSSLDLRFNAVLIDAAIKDVLLLFLPFPRIRLPPPRILHREWVHVVRTNGLSLSQALPLVTSNVARVLAIDDRKGSLAPGKDADILFLTPDLMVDTVIARGRIMVRDGRALVRGPFEERGDFDYAL